MRILLISNCSFNEAQGSGYGITNFYLKGLASLGATVDAYPPDNYECFQLFRPRANSYRQAIGMLLLVIRKIFLNEYDAVVFYGAESFLAVSWLKKMTTFKGLIVNHSNGIENHSMDVLKSIFESPSANNSKPKWYPFSRYNLFLRAFTSSDIIITNGIFDTDYLLRKNIIIRDSVFTIPYGLNNEYLRLGFKKKKNRTIGFCGSWIARKGIDVIKNDVSIFLSRNPDYKFYIIGCGNFFEKEKIFDQGIVSRIEVFPFVGDKTILLNIYNKIDVLIFPSYYDSFGLVLSEAMACSCAIICSDTGFAYSLKHKYDCYKLPSVRCNELLFALETVTSDDDLRLSIAQNGYTTVQELQWTQQVNKLQEVLVQQIRNKKQSSRRQVV